MRLYANRRSDNQQKVATVNHGANQDALTWYANRSSGGTGEARVRTISPERRHTQSNFGIAPIKVGQTKKNTMVNHGANQHAFVRQ